MKALLGWINPQGHPEIIQAWMQGSRQGSYRWASMATRGATASPKRARLVLSQAMIAIDRELKLPIVTCSHDEIVIILKNDGDAETTVKACVDIMKRAPAWLPGVPLDPLPDTMRCSQMSAT